MIMSHYVTQYWEERTCRFKSAHAYAGINEIDGPKMGKIGFEESTALEHTYEMIDTLRY